MEKNRDPIAEARKGKYFKKYVKEAKKQIKKDIAKYKRKIAH